MGGQYKEKIQSILKEQLMLYPVTRVVVLNKSNIFFDYNDIFSFYGNNIEIIYWDMNHHAYEMPHAQLVIADGWVEVKEYPVLKDYILKIKPCYVSVVLPLMTHEGFYYDKASWFEDEYQIIQDAPKYKFCNMMSDISYQLIYQKEELIPDEILFARMDYKRI